MAKIPCRKCKTKLAKAFKQKKNNIYIPHDRCAAYYVRVNPLVGYESRSGEAK